MDKKPGGPRPERDSNKRQFLRYHGPVEPILGEEYVLTPYPGTALTQTEYNKLQRKVPPAEAMVDDSEERVIHDPNITSPNTQATEWRDQAVCKGLDSNLFYPEGREGTDIVRGICSQCPVQAQCLGHAMATGEQYGVWGGKSPGQRNKERNKDKKREKDS